MYMLHSPVYKQKCLYTCNDYDVLLSQASPSSRRVVLLLMTVQASALVQCLVTLVRLIYMYKGLPLLSIISMSCQIAPAILYDASIGNAIH